MPENQVEKYDPSKLMDEVRAKIKATFVDLIPEEAWTQMVEAEMKNFFEPKQIDKGQWANPRYETVPSEFQKMALELFREHAKTYIKTLLDSPKYKMESVYMFDHDTGEGRNKVTLSEELDKLIEEKMPGIMNAMFTQIFKEGVYRMFSNFRSNGQLS